MALRRRLQDMATQPPPRSPFRTRSVESEQTPSGAALRRPRSQDALSATLSDRSEKAAFGATRSLPRIPATVPSPSLCGPC
jgi:hypothetical protein